MSEEGIPFNSIIYEGECERTSTAQEPFWLDMTFTIWSPPNTWLNRVKWRLGWGEKPELITRSWRSVVEPELMFDKLPMEKIGCYIAPKKEEIE